MLQDQSEDCGEAPNGGKMVMGRARKPKPAITTERRRQLLALSIELVDRVLKGTEPHERRLFFKMTDQQLMDVNNGYDGE